MNLEAPLSVLIHQWPRIVLALLLLWMAAVVGLQVLPRARTADAPRRRGWLAAGSVLLGSALWTASSTIVSAVADTFGQPAPGIGTLLLAFPLCIGAATMALLGARAKRIERRASGGAGCFAILIAAAGVWGWGLDLALPGGDFVGFGALLVALSGGIAVAVMLPNGHARALPKQAVLVTLDDLITAAWMALAALPSLLMLGAVLARKLDAPVAPSPAMIGPEALPALLAMLMLALVQGVILLERRLQQRQEQHSVFQESIQGGVDRQPMADPLTGLQSRVSLERVLREAGGKAKERNGRMALLYIGLDGFKAINESFGHATGDELLRAYAHRLTDALRNCPGVAALGPHELARTGGDEYALLLRGSVTRRTLSKAADELLNHVAKPITSSGREVSLTASIGVSLYPDHGSVGSLMQQADAAMHAAKETGGATFMFYDSRMKDDARDRIELVRDLRRAIDDNQLELYYQPKIDARSGLVTAAEALLRWHHPTRGTLGPGVFVPLAERYGLIAQLGNWVIEDACRQARVWRDAGLKMRVAINLSAYQMRQSDLVDRIQAALKTYGIKPERLTCEITESVAMEDTQVTQVTFERLGRAGVHVSIDDFGTGHSSLAYLRRLPATELKIDRSFVMDVDRSADAEAIIRAVIQLARAMDMKVVAEGVETEAQRDALLHLDCDEFQGYLFARPMTARALLMWAADDRQHGRAFRDSLFASPDNPGEPQSVQYTPRPQFTNSRPTSVS